MENYLICIAFKRSGTRALVAGLLNPDKPLFRERLHNTLVDDCSRVHTVCLITSATFSGWFKSLLLVHALSFTYYRRCIKYSFVLYNSVVLQALCQTFVTINICIILTLNEEVTLYQ